MKSESIFRILNARNLGLIPPNHQHLPQDQIASDERRCCAFDGIRRGVIYYELLKPGEIVNAHRYHQQLIKLHHALREKSRIIGKDITSWFSSTTHRRTRQQWSKTTWRHSTGKCYSIPLIHQIWHLLIITCFRRWATRSLSGTSILTKIRKWLDEWFASKDEEFFWRGTHKFPERWEKCTVSEGKYFE